MPFQIVRNDITKMAVDAIVNTANPFPGYGAGTDTAVYQGAGPNELLKDRHEIGFIEQGTSAITPGYNLPAKYIIHTVGCGWQGGNRGEEDIVRKCYRSSFAIAKERELESIAFPLLSSGSYGFPKGIALRIALSEISDFLKENDMRRDLSRGFSPKFIKSYNPGTFLNLDSTVLGTYWMKAHPPFVSVGSCAYAIIT